MEWLGIAYTILVWPIAALIWLAELVLIGLPVVNPL